MTPVPMTRVEATPARRHARLRISTTQPTQFIDLTDDVEAFVDAAGVRAGIINLQTLHTTTAIVLNEHEPLLLGDFTALLERTAPLRAPYRHDDFSVRTVNLIPGEVERVNGHAHCRALFLSPSACLNIVDGRLELGRWQRIFLAELDGPRVRELSIVVIAADGR